MKRAANSLLNTTVYTSHTMPPDNHFSLPPRSFDFPNERRVRFELNINLHTTSLFPASPLGNFRPSPNAERENLILIYRANESRAVSAFFLYANQFSDEWTALNSILYALQGGALSHPR
jgi:hypothetical protein